MSFLIPAAVALYVHTCVMGCRYPNYSNFFCRIMIYISVTKHPPVSDSAAEAAKKTKTLQLTCIGPFKSSHVHFVGMIPKKKYPASRLRASGSVRYDASVSARKITSEALNLTTAFVFFSM